MTAPRDTIAQRASELANMTGARLVVHASTLGDLERHYGDVAQCLSDVTEKEMAPWEVLELMAKQRMKNCALQSFSQSNYLDVAMFILIACALREGYASE